MLTKNYCKYTFIIWMTMMVFFVSCHQKSEKHLYPLDPEIKTLSEDLQSQAYKDVVNTMLYQDLIEEWKRVATADNYIVFRETHGGIEKIKADSLLSRAYEERKQIANDFLAFMEETFRSKNRNPNFDIEQAEQLMLSEMKRSEALANFEVIHIKPIMAARGAEKQWPGFRGPTGQGIAHGKKFPLTWSKTENVVWKVPLTGRGNSSPVIWDNRIFITSASDDGTIRELYCFNRKNGDLLWKGAAPVPENVERLYWKNTFASSTPVIDGERVIVFFGNSGMVCFNMDGALQWTQDLGEFTIMHGPGTNPVLYKNKVILIQDQNRDESVFVALDKQTGEILWRKNRDRATGWSSPILVQVDGKDELIYNGSHHVKGYNPDTGEEIWTVNGSTREAVPMIVSGGGLYYSASGRNGTIMAIRPGGKGEITDTHKLWFNERGGPHVPSPVYYKERLYMINDTGIATCLNVLNGKTVWRHRLDGRFSMSPVLIGDKIIVTNEVGLTTIFKAGDSFEVLAENDLEEETLSSPALLDGKLYFRTAEHLYCIGK